MQAHKEQLMDRTYDSRQADVFCPNCGMPQDQCDADQATGDPALLCEA